MPMLFKNNLRHAALCALTVLTLAGCASNGGDLSPADSVATSVSVVSHYGKGISITDSYLNGGYIGVRSGWGGGGATQCVCGRFACYQYSIQRPGAWTCGVVPTQCPDTSQYWAWSTESCGANQ